MIKKELLAGDKFSELTVIRELPIGSRLGRNFRRILCSCSCGREHIANRSELINNRTKRCALCFKELHNYGKPRRLEQELFVKTRKEKESMHKFPFSVGNFKILGFAQDRKDPNGRIRKYFNCLCFCGKMKEITAQTILHKRTLSCGCLQKKSIKKIRTTHGESKKTSEYTIWCGMKRRCYNKKDAAYENYGGRGLTVCSDWLCSFEKFLEDMGRRPSTKHSIERVNNSLGYFKDNCIWATRIEQNNNRRKRRCAKKPISQQPVKVVK